MTVETKVDPSRQNQSGWQSEARRYGENCDTREKPRADAMTDSELIFPPISPPPVWPRVFPGL